jgi:hypothetical protein
MDGVDSKKRLIAELTTLRQSVTEIRDHLDAYVEEPREQSFATLVVCPTELVGFGSPGT